MISAQMWDTIARVFYYGSVAGLVLVLLAAVGKRRRKRTPDGAKKRITEAVPKNPSGILALIFELCYKVFLFGMAVAFLAPLALAAVHRNYIYLGLLPIVLPMWFNAAVCALIASMLKERSKKLAAEKKSVAV